MCTEMFDSYTSTFFFENIFASLCQNTLHSGEEKKIKLFPGFLPTVNW